MNHPGNNHAGDAATDAGNFPGLATARPATPDDLARLVTLYRALEAEMLSLSPMWRMTSGLAEPVESSMAALLDASRSTDQILIGAYAGYPFGFMWGRIEGMLPQADGERLGAIRLVFVEQDARAVGVGETMRDGMLEWFRSQGLRRFDAHVLPGHRLAKNFFEQGGFSARHIVMHHDDG